MNIQQAEEYLNMLRESGMSEGIENMRRLAERLGNPQNKPKNIIHIAGTNGKGTTGALTEAALRAAGFSVGRYSSPAVFSRFEIIKKNLKNIQPPEFAELITAVKAAAEKENMIPSVFEAETAAAFLYMKDCDFAVTEAGLGGKGDSTNVVTAPKTAVITPVSLDHVKILGGTISEIAAEKCGIFNPYTTVVVAKQTDEALEVIKEKSAGLKTVFAGEPYNVRRFADKTVFDLKEIKDIEIPFCGEYHLTNAAAAAAALMSLGISEKHIKQGFLNTVWRGRFEKISENPAVIADGAHNEQAFFELRKNLEEYYPNEKFVFITGIFKDKNYRAAARIFSPIAKKVYTITPPNERALSGAELAEVFCAYGADVETTSIEKIPDIIEKDTTNVVFGSLSFLGELYKILGV